MQSGPKPDVSQHEALEAERAKLRATLPDDVEKTWQRYPGRIGVVLSGGGARGAYEAGVLLAFQDARLPTHIIAATSVGSINAASYAGHSETLVGNAESLVESWSVVTPPAVGIDWFRYILVLGGLTALTAGFGNLARVWLSENQVFVHVQSPKLTWFALGMTGAAFLYFHDNVSYMGHVLRNYFGQRRWQPDRKKVLRSIAGNVVVWGCASVFLSVSSLQLTATEFLYPESESALLVFALLALAGALAYFFRARISTYSHQFLRLPLRTGLFPNFERTRFLRDRIPDAKLRKSPIRVVMTAADVNTGGETCFTNTAKDVLARDPGADPRFVEVETTVPDDLLLAVIASSAFPIVYETVPMAGGLWTDGGIVSNQPIRPAIRLGADVLFLVMVEPRSQRRGEIKTFLDLGVRALDILMSQNLKTDMSILNNVNSLCEQYAAQLGLRPEQIILQVGARRYRFLKAIAVEPTEYLAATVLDFDGRITAPAVVQGYRDGARAVVSFEQYISDLPSGMREREVRLVAESLARPISGP